MAKTHISTVTQHAFGFDGPFTGWIDAPASGYQSDGPSFPISGWVIGNDAPVATVELRYEDIVLRSAPVAYARHDVAAVYPRYPDPQRFDRSGFATAIGTLGLADDFIIQVDVVHTDGHRAHWGDIHGRRDPLRSAFVPTLQPLMVTCLGRTGTTLLMRLLGDHPAIVLQRLYPYEARWGAYWMHLLKVLAEPGTFMDARHLISSLEDLETAHQNPFNTEHYLPDRDLSRWLNAEYPGQFAAFCQRSTEQFYRVVARSQGQAHPAFFAEKCFPGLLPDVTWELYPQAREVFSVRDFRDMICSIIAFVAKPGRTVLGYSNEESAEAIIQHVGREVALLLQSWKRRSARASLVRYEDLALHPVETLERLFASLDLGLSRARIAEIIENAARTTPELAHHGTTASVEQSIGRWKRDLDPALHRYVDDACGAALAEFGYA